MADPFALVGTGYDLMRFPIDIALTKLVVQSNNGRVNANQRE